MCLFYKLLSLLLIIIVDVPSAHCLSKDSKSQVDSDSSSILIFTKTEGYRHQSIPQGVETIEEIASENDISTFHTENAAYFQPDSLAKFDIVLFLSTTGDILNEDQQDVFEQYIKGGGGFIGIHAATDTEYNWPWYGEMVGAYFKSHPEIQQATITVVDKDHPSTSFLPDTWERTDEWYNFKNINPDINVLMNLEESSYEGGENGEEHPIAWYHEFEGSRIFYTGGGHTTESYSEPLFKKHLQGGINYVLERN